MTSNKGQELWQKAKKIIPGGNQLLSKRSEKFLPGLWPSYYSKAKGCEVWDLDGNHYHDFAQMGVGSCIIGYADEDVDAAVIKAIQNGSMSSLNCAEEVELVEKLISLHPWTEMARFARTGGEACAIAIRIARAASGKNKVAFCGYHGWHDWFLAANLGNSSNLDGQLLPGLDPLGVPRELHETSIPFNYNKLDELEAIIDKYPNEIGVIIMEPQRDIPPEPGFLEDVRNIATRIGAVLIFDEVTSGFRMNLGGIHLIRGVNPDVAVFGKALGNGYPISAIIGRRAVMEHAQDTFISSTFWTERIGFTGALAAIKKMEERSVQKQLIHYGNLINEGWTALAQKHGIDIRISGIPPLTHITFKAEDPLAVQTLYTQEMLARGYLLGAAVYTTYAYSEEVINKFLENSDEVFGTIKTALGAGDVYTRLKGDIIHAGFKRLT
ncbi:aminotransferase class III-fold pyridoxal phosphate-dependent enzyme [bacterium]|nr:aminotransferase class III-fold pyridoxal phosphate-dependent enzyme [bacterium]